MSQLLWDTKDATVEGSKNTDLYSKMVQSLPVLKKRKCEIPYTMYGV